MRYSSFRAGLWLVVAGLLPGGLNAGESLSQAWSKALATDAGLAAVSLDTEAARAGERAARAARLPQIEVGASYTRMADAPALSVVTPEFAFISPRIFDDDDFVMRHAQLSLPIFAGGSLSSGVRAADAARQAAESDERRARADLKLAVAETYLGVLRSQRALRAAEASVAALESHLQDVTAMVEVQARANTDLLASRVATAGAKQQLTRARLGVATALGHYNRHLGEPLDRVVELEAVPPAVLEMKDSPLAELQERAVRQRGEIAGLDARADSLQAASRAEFGKMLPTVAVTASYQQLENTVLDREEFTMMGVAFRWALFDGGQARHRATALRRSSDSVRQRRNELESIVRLEVQQARLGIEAADARVSLTRDAIAEANENLRITRDLYAESLVTNTQVLEAIALQTAAEGQAADAVFDASIARLRLLKAIGEL
jgi:outer membrane protein TolC